MAAKKSKGPTGPKSPQKKGTAAQFRKMLLEDPNTEKIAEKLGVPLEAYIKQVVHFATHPDEEPEIIYVSDEDLRSEGFTPPDNDAMGRYILDGIKVQQAAAGTGYQKAQKKLVDMSDRAEGEAVETTDPGLKAELAKELRRGGRKG